MIEKIQRYFELKDQIKVLDDELKAIRSEVSTLFGGAKVEIEVDGSKVRCQTKKRSTKSCDWSTFKEVNEHLYNQIVTESESSYYELRKLAR